MTRVFAIAVWFAALVPCIAFAQHTGVVFDDVNASGVLDAGERGRAGIAVTNGRDVVITGVDGRYELVQQGAGFIAVTCPADGRCPVWFRRGGGDFAVVPEPVVRDFFFVHVSDIHAYPKVEDLAALLPAGGLPWWLPRNLVGWLLLFGIEDFYPDRPLAAATAATLPSMSRSTAPSPVLAADWA